MPRWNAPLVIAGVLVLWWGGGNTGSTVEIPTVVLLLVLLLVSPVRLQAQIATHCSGLPDAQIKQSAIGSGDFVGAGLDV